MTPPLTLAVLCVLLEAWFEDLRESAAVAASTTTRAARFAPHVACAVGAAAARLVARSAGWWLQDGFRVSLDVLDLHLFTRGDLVDPQAAWYHLAAFLSEPCLEVLFWAEAATEWFPFHRHTTEETELFLFIRLPGGHALEVLFHLAWLGDEQDEAEQGDGDDQSLPDSVALFGSDHSEEYVEVEVEAEEFQDIEVEEEEEMEVVEVEPMFWEPVD